jgi:hypothetical protein
MLCEFTDQSASIFCSHSYKDGRNENSLRTKDSRKGRKTKLRWTETEINKGKEKERKVT